MGDAPVSVSAWGQCVLQAGIEDDMHLHMRFPSGGEGHVHASWLWPERRRRLAVVGTGAMVTYDEDDHKVTLRRRRALPDLTVQDEGSEVLHVGDPRPLAAELKHFLSCVADRSIPRSDGRGALPVVRVLEESARQLRRSE
jgi:predicted dehydrogenase